MGLTKDEKKEIVGKFGANANDSGRTEVQVAILTKRINELSAKHFSKNKKVTLHNHT